MLTSACGGTTSTDSTPPAATFTARDASYPRLLLRSTSSCAPAASMIFVVPLVPTTSSCSITSTGNGADTVIQPATGASERGSENTTSVVTPLATATLRCDDPASEVTVTVCCAAERPSMTSGDTPRGLPSTATRTPGGSVTIDSRPGAAAAPVGVRSKYCDI